MRDLLQDLFDQQRILLQTEFRDTYRNLAARFAHELRREEPPIEESPPVLPAPALHRVPGILALAAVALIVIALFWQRELTVQHLQQRVAELSEQVISRSGMLLPQDGPQLTGYKQSVQASQAATLDALEWGVNHVASYGFDELPFGESRLLLFQELFDRLVALGFSAVALTAGEWNTIAAANNRVTVTLQPDSGDSQPVL